MQSESPVVVSKPVRWTGYIMSTLPVLMLLMSAYMKIAKRPEAVEGFIKGGFAEKILVPLGIVELVCTILYVIPQTAVLGAILLTGYLGGAVCTHLRAGESIVMPLLFGVFLWGGIFLRDPRLRALMPLRRRIHFPLQSST